MGKKILLLYVFCFLLFPLSSWSFSFYIGGGLNHNSVSNLGSATGFEFLAGIEFPLKYYNFSTSLEAGIISTGSFSYAGQSVGHANGPWAAVLAKYILSSNLSGLIRLGYDWGDSTRLTKGALFGFGAEYAFFRLIALRTEYVIRDEVNSLQINCIFRF